MFSKCYLPSSYVEATNSMGWHLEMANDKAIGLDKYVKVRALDSINALVSNLN